MNTDKLLNMLLEAIDYSFLQTDGSYDKELTWPVIDKVKYIKGLIKEEPVSEDLDTAAKNWSEDEENTRGCDYIGEAVAETAFKAGAKWQKQQDQSTIELAEDHAMLAGMEKMKEQMMKDAIDAEVLENYDGKVIKYDDTILDEKLSNCKVFDKVKMILVKEE